MKRTAKKVLSMVIGAGLLMGLCSCGETSQQNADGENVYKIGVTQIMDHPSLDNCREGFIQGLANKGFVEGDNIEIEYKSAQGDPDIATQITQNFAADKKDLVCGIATPSAQSLYSVCLENNIPVIFNAVSDPVAAKLAVSQTQALEGISGVSDELPVEDQLTLIRAMLPQAKKIGILYTTSEDNSVSTLEVYKELASQFGFEIVEKGVGTEAEIPAALDVILNEVDCISNMTDNTVVANLALMLQKAGEKNIPVFGSEEEQVKNGCVASAGLDYIQLGIQAGEMAADVLNGTDISTIPYQTLKESKLTVNETAAAELGITIPEDIYSKAEMVQ